MDLLRIHRQFQVSFTTEEALRKGLEGHVPV